MEDQESGLRQAIEIVQDSARDAHGLASVSDQIRINVLLVGVVAPSAEAATLVRNSVVGARCVIVKGGPNDDVTYSRFREAGAGRIEETAGAAVGGVVGSVDRGT